MYSSPGIQINLIDFLTHLQTAENDIFYPKAKEWTYEKDLQAGSTDITNRFIPDISSKSFLNNLSWNHEKLNVNVFSEIFGTVLLDDRAESLGLIKQFPTKIYRNFSLIQRGRIKVPFIIAELSNSTLDFLADHNALSTIEAFYSESLQKNVQKIFLDRFAPVPMDDANRHLDLLVDLVFKEWVLSNKLSYYKKMISNHPGTIEGRTKFTPEQIEYLKTFDITPDGVYSPKFVKDTSKPSNSSDDSLKFSIKIDKCSSVPKVEDVLLKLQEGKNITLREKVIAGTHSYFNSIQIKSDEVLPWLKETVRTLQKDLSSVQNLIFKIKYFDLIGRQNFRKIPIQKEFQYTKTIEDLGEVTLNISIVR